MAPKKPFTLEIKNGQKDKTPAAALHPLPAIVPSKRDAHREKLEARAQLIAVYAGVLGIEASSADIVETLLAEMPGDAKGAQEIAAIEAGLRRAGLVTHASEISAPSAKGLPALGLMTSGQVLLILGFEDGEYIIYDKTCPGNRAQVPGAEFLPFFTGQLIQAEAKLAQLETSHKLDTRKGHWFWGHFRRFRRYMAEIALGSFVANILAVSVALFSLQVYDRVIPHQSEATLWVLGIGAALALLFEGLLKIARARLMDGAGRQIELSVLQTLMQRILGARSDTASAPPSMRFSQMREFSSVREFFTASTIGTLADVPFIFVFLLLVASIAGPVVWVLILGGLLMIVPGFFLQKRMIRLTQETQGASAKSGRVLQEAIYELDTVKTQRAEERMQRLWSELTALSALKSSEQRKLAATITFWSQGVQQATYVGAVIAGTYMVFAGQLTVGAIIAVGILTSRTLSPLTGLAGTMARWGTVKTALQGLNQIAEAPQDTAQDRSYLRRKSLSGAYDFHEVTFRYEEESAAVVELPALRILPGQRLAVLGANGSGKSTFLKLLSGLYAPQTGRVLIDGTEMSQIAPKDLRRSIGYLGQDVRLFAGTLRDNLNLTLLERDDDRLLAALDFAGLGTYVRGHSKGLDLEIQDGGQGLSIGQRQSIGWARLWLQDPQICLLDEPTAALDQALEAGLIKRLGAWLEGRTAIIATHRVPILALTNRTMVLQAGRLCVDGPQNQVLHHLSGGKVAKLPEVVA